jgi:Tol biopolymer transport system component
MMRKYAVLVGAVAAAVVLSWGIQSSGDPKILLEKAKYAMETQGDYQGAIKLFEQVLASNPKDRASAAQAQLSIGLCYEKLGGQEARKAFEKVVSDYPDQSDAVKAARARLEAMRPAGGRGADAGDRPRLRQVWAGGDATSLTAISPDGKYFAYSRNACEDMYIRNVETGETRQITHEADTKNFTEFACFTPAWSPDGTQLAYCWFNKAGFWEMRTVDVRTGEHKIVYSNKDNQSGSIYDWSKDGKFILSSAGAKAFSLLIVSVESGTWQTLLKGKSQVRRAKFSPDAAFVVFDHAGTEAAWAKDISIVEVSSGRETALVKHPADDTLIGWTPDGSSVLFASNRSGTVDLYALGLNQGNWQDQPQMVKSEVGASESIGISSQGTIFYAVDNRATDVFSAKIDVKSGKMISPPRKISLSFEGKNDLPRISPDGTRVVYGSSRGPQTSASRMRANMIVVQTLASGKEAEFSLPFSIPTFYELAWSADSRQLFFIGSDADKKLNLYRMDPNTGVHSKLIEEPIKGGACMSSDGNDVFLILGNSIREGSIQRLNIARGTKETIFTAPALPGRIALSPDNKRLVFRLISSSGEQMTDQIVLLPVEGGNSRVLLQNTGSNSVFYQLGWTPDSQNVLISKIGTDENHHLWIVPLDGSPARETEVKARMLRSFSLRAEDGLVVYAAGDFSSDNQIWAIENFLPKKTAGK